jgi:hypothetical protein
MKFFYYKSLLTNFQLINKVKQLTIDDNVYGRIIKSENEIVLGNFDIKNHRI